MPSYSQRAVETPVLSPHRPTLFSTCQRSHHPKSQKVKVLSQTYLLKDQQAGPVFSNRLLAHQLVVVCLQITPVRVAICSEHLPQPKPLRFNRHRASSPQKRVCFLTHQVAICLRSLLLLAVCSRLKIYSETRRSKNRTRSSQTLDGHERN